MITRVDFIGLPTRDLEVAVRFYGETLGLERSAYRPARPHAEFETGNLTINVMNSERMGLQHVVNGNPIALHVGDVAGARSRPAGRGVGCGMDPIDTGGCRMAFFSGPDGNALMLHHRYAPQT